ncbi:putative toxin [Microbacterium sp. T32]|uniref:putative toxin n=1 Tax=Microbacterium sp. T32 TaxID=1776083 RepID=UPI0007AC1FBA|nr:putative toxin [Microbacterium sp. T32]KZE42714.1 hypothetical protein AVW09_08730 [Microbacterium sp. T32]
MQFAAVKQQEEDEANYMSRRAVDTTSSTPSEAEIAAARAAGGQAAVDELTAARQSLGSGDLAQYIISIGGQLLLDFFGITDIVNCVTKGDLGACAMGLIGFLPIGKIFQAGKAIALLGKLVPQIVEFFAKHQSALRTIEKYSSVAVACGVGAGFRVAASSLASQSSCGGPGPVRLGQAGEEAVRNAVDIGIKPTKPPIDMEGLPRIPDGLTATTLTEVKNVSKLSYTKQLRDYVTWAKKQDPKIVVHLYVRGAPNATNLSDPLIRAITAGDIKIFPIPFP